jgi:CheY-like chemotaxis protein
MTAIPTSSWPIPPAPLRILVVDDNPREFILLEQGFASCGISFSLLTATTAILALAEITMADRDELPHVAVVDINMPLVSGFDLATHLVNQHLPTILVSVQVDVWRSEHARAVGALNLLAKPTHADGYDVFAAQILNLIPYRDSR